MTLWDAPRRLFTRFVHQMMHVLLTHSSGKLETLEPALVKAGFTVSHRPAIVTRACLDQTTYNSAIYNSAIYNQAKRLLTCPWLAFTSRSAVSAWQQLGLPFTDNVAAVGEKTARAIETAGGRVALVAAKKHVDDLARQLIEHVAPCEVGLPQGNLALGTLEQRLKQAGFTPKPVTVYHTEIQAPLTLTELEGIDAVVLASPSAVQCLPDGLPEQVTLVAFGTRTAKAIAARGYECMQTEIPSSDAVVRVLEGIKH
jgi:uroporphyrinogen-III synthase